MLILSFSLENFQVDFEINLLKTDDSLSPAWVVQVVNLQLSPCHSVPSLTLCYIALLILYQQNVLLVFLT